MSWTEERTDRLKQLWADGWSCSQIAADLGDVSRNAVIGKVHRLGLTLRRTLSGIPKADRKPITRVVIRPKRKSTYGGEVEIVEFKTTPDAPIEIPESRRKTFMELEPHHCRFPYGDVGTPELFFCGAERLGNLPYCVAHARIAYSRAADHTAAERELYRRRMARARKAKAA